MRGTAPRACVSAHQSLLRVGSASFRSLSVNGAALLSFVGRLKRLQPSALLSSNMLYLWQLLADPHSNATTRDTESGVSVSTLSFKSQKPD